MTFFIVAFLDRIHVFVFFFSSSSYTMSAAKCKLRIKCITRCDKVDKKGNTKIIILYRSLQKCNTGYSLILGV